MNLEKKNKLPPLEWDEALAKIGAVHSKDMGERRVPFGHDGFKERMKKYPLSTSAGGENVAMNKGMHDVARVAVDGWIDSPGHRKNLLGRWDRCGIGVYRNPVDNGFFFYTVICWISVYYGNVRYVIKL